MSSMTRREWNRAALGSLAAAAASPSPRQASLTGEYRYLHLDVFTDRALTGNQLAVFLETPGLDAETMLAIAREMNFSETTFVLPREDEGTDVRMRIFAPDRELPFAGHPTIGTTFALAHAGVISPDRRRFVFGLGAGPTPVDLEWQESRLSFAWMTQQRPSFGKVVDQPAAVAACLGVEPSAIQGGDRPVQEVSCGSAFLLVPMASRQAVDAASLDRRAMESLYKQLGMERRGVFVFSTEPSSDGATAYSRMFGFGVVEDPATGSASGPLGCYLVRHGVVSPAQAEKILSVQGVKMRRPSRIHISIGTSGSEIVSVRVGGESVLVGSGTLNVTV